MKFTEKMALIDKIGRELQKRYTYKEIDVFFSHFSLQPIRNETYNSRWVYSKDVLNKASDDIVIKIAKELEIGFLSTASMPLNAPAIWMVGNTFRLFISHISAHKDKAYRIKETLAPYYISGFVAHEDIAPTMEWQEEIHRALLTMDAMVAICTEGFAQSVWTQQEIGFALGRGTRILSIHLGEDPKGFVGKIQAIRRKKRSAERISEEIVKILRQDDTTKSRINQVEAFHKALNDDDIPF